MTCLFVVRHGNTFAPGEAARRIGRRTDLPLVASGVAQAAALGTWFDDRGIVFERVLSGPLLRVRQTADIILERRVSKPTVEIVPWLDEIDYGPDENQVEDDVVTRIGRDGLARWDDEGIAPQDWQTDEIERLAAWRAMIDTPPSKPMLLLTSNGAARFLFLACPALKPVGSMKLATGSFAKIDWVTREPRLSAWNVRPEIS